MALSFGFYFFSYLYQPEIYKVVYKDINYLLLVGVLREELCQKEECFTVPEWTIVTADNSRNRTPFDQIPIIDLFQYFFSIFDKNPYFRVLINLIWYFYYDLYIIDYAINSYSLLFFAFLFSFYVKKRILFIDKTIFYHISKTVKPKNKNPFSFDRSRDFEQLNINFESI